MCLALREPGSYEIKGCTVTLTPSLADEWPRIVMRSDGGFRRGTARAAFGVAGDFAYPPTSGSDKWTRQRFLTWGQEVNADDSFQAETAGLLAAFTALQEFVDSLVSRTFQRACGA